jgi:hypothetical protein
MVMTKPKSGPKTQAENPEVGLGASAPEPVTTSDAGAPLDDAAISGNWIVTWVKVNVATKEVVEKGVLPERFETKEEAEEASDAWKEKMQAEEDQKESPVFRFSSCSEEDKKAKIARWKEELEDTLSNEDTVQAVIEFLIEEGLDLDDVTVEEGIWGWPETSDCATVYLGKDKDYMVFPDNDTAESFAKALVLQDIQEQPELFSEGFLDKYIDEEHLRDKLKADVEEDVRESPDSYGYEPKYKAILVSPDGVTREDFGVHDDEDDASRAAQDEIDSRNANLEEDEGDEWAYEIEEVEPDDDPDFDSWVEDKVDEILRDPILYLQDIYGNKDGLAQAIKIGGINEEEAADACISADGWQNFVGSYDGNATDLESGGVYCRHN